MQLAPCGRHQGVPVHEECAGGAGQRGDHPQERPQDPAGQAGGAQGAEDGLGAHL